MSTEYDLSGFRNLSRRIGEQEHFDDFKRDGLKYGPGDELFQPNNATAGFLLQLKRSPEDAKRFLAEQVQAGRIVQRESDFIVAWASGADDTEFCTIGAEMLADELKLGLTFNYKPLWQTEDADELNYQMLASFCAAKWASIFARLGFAEIRIVQPEADA